MIYRFLPDAIYALEPNAHFRINGNFTFENLTWEPHVDKAIIPTEQAIAQKANELVDDLQRCACVGGCLESLECTS